MDLSFIENMLGKGLYYLYIFKLVVGFQSVLEGKLKEKGVNENNIVFFMILSTIVIFITVLVFNYYTKNHLTKVIEKYIPKSLTQRIMAIFMGSTVLSLIIKGFSATVRIL